VDLMKLQPREEHPHGLTDFEFDTLFTTDRPIIFAYHGYPWLIHRLTYRRHGHRNLHVRGYKEEGTTILLVEQNARIALSIADYGYIMENGKIVMDDPVDKLKENEDVKEFYLGMTEVGTRKSYKETKHYKRRKRWLS